MCQTIHTYFPRLLLPTYPILFAICSRFIHIHVHTFERQLHVIFAHAYTHLKTNSDHTFIGKAIFVLLIHILERQFHMFLF